MKLIRSNPRRHTVLSLAAFSLLLLAASSALANPVKDPDVPATPAGFEPQTIQEQVQLAGNYLAGHGVQQDSKRAAFWYEKAAGAGDPQAQLQTGYLYEAGIGVPKDPVRAFHWYQLASSGGLVSAKVNLGIAYLFGDGVEKNQQAAFALFHEAAEKGSGLAACFLGEVYHSGIGVVQNDAEAERWYAKGAELRNPQAQYVMGSLYFAETNHERDLNTAATLLRQSAQAGYVPAMYQLGLLLEQNPKLALNSGEATGFLNTAANAGSWTSSMLLGVLARDGKDETRDASTAYFQFRVAVLEGGDEAEKRLNHDLQQLTSELGRERTATLDAQAAEWQAHHHAVLEFVYKQGDNETGFPAYALAVPENGGHTALLLPAEARIDMAYSQR
jgi:TPR repeat protein